MNEHLKKEEFKYSINQSTITHEGSYVFKFKRNHLEKTELISLDKLSPGEQIILLLLQWQYIYSKYEVFGKTILLFDEPDAHLHPSAVNHFIKILTKLAQMGIQIIMTTHNPITAHFVNENNLFLLYEEDFKIKIKSGITTYEIANSLTDKLVNIESPSKILLVEGK